MLRATPRPLAPPRAWHVLAALPLALVLLALTTIDASAYATPGDDAPAPELQPAPEDGQEQFGEPADEDTERVARLLRLVLGGLVAVVILLLVILLPLRLRKRGAEQRDAPSRGP